jgi:predicted enzyme related to lactoylglutathione lyase
MHCQTLQVNVQDLEAGIRFYSSFLGYKPQQRGPCEAVWQDARICLTLVVSTRCTPQFLL